MELSSEPSMRLRGADAVKLHLTLAAGLTLCVGAFSFELARALGGHTFSWLYVFEWPLFAGFALYMWWNLLHGHDRRRAPARAPAAGMRSGGSGGTEPEPDEGLAAWNRYLADMEAAEGDDLTDRAG